MVSARVAAEAVNELTLKPDQSERADQSVDIAWLSDPIAFWLLPILLCVFEMMVAIFIIADLI